MSTEPSTACVVCGGPLEVWFELPHIWHQPKGSRPYAIYRCDRCGLGLLLPRPSQAELNSFYGDTYFTRRTQESPERAAAQIDDARKQRTWLDRVRIHLAWRLDRGRPFDAASLSEVLGAGSHEICDLGCGNGDLLAEFKARGHRVVGVEVDEDARRNAGNKGIETHVGYAEALPDAIQRRTFDLVTMIHVLEHCADPLQALRNAFELLRPGGYLAIEVPNNEAIFAEQLGPAWFNCDAGRHLNFFTAKSLVSHVLINLRETQSDANGSPSSARQPPARQENTRSSASSPVAVLTRCPVAADRNHCHSE